MANDFLSKDFDIYFENGDLACGESSQQHVEDILVSRPGDFKNAPWIGVAIQDLLNAPTSPLILERLNKEIRLQLESDSAKVKTVSTVDITNIQIEARYD